MRPFIVRGLEQRQLLLARMAPRSEERQDDRRPARAGQPERLTSERLEAEVGSELAQPGVTGDERVNGLRAGGSGSFAVVRAQHPREQRTRERDRHDQERGHRAA